LLYLQPGEGQNLLDQLVKRCYIFTHSLQ